MNHTFNYSEIQSAAGGKLQKELKRIPNNKQNAMVWGAIRAKGKISCHTYRSNMDALFYIKILQIHLLPAARQQYAQQ